MAHVYIASGDVHVLRRRFVDDILYKKNRVGWSTQKINGRDERALSYALGDAEMLGGKHLFHITHPEKGDLDTYKAHVETGSADIILLLEVGGNPKGSTRFGKWVKEMKANHKAFATSGKSWNLQEESENVLKAELKRLGKTIDERLIPVIVDRVGAHPGVMVFEAMKYAGAAGPSSEITPDVIKGLMAELGNPDVFALAEAVGVRYASRVAQLMTRIKKRSRKDPTIQMSRLLCKSVVTWIAADGGCRGIQASEAAEVLGISSWLYTKKVLPALARWGEKDLHNLLRACTKAERSVLEGHVDPWSGFTASLLTLC